MLVSAAGSCPRCTARERASVFERAVRLDSLSLHIFPMSDLEDRYLAMLVINEIDDPVTPLSYPVTVGISGELFRAVRPGIPGKGLIR
jgi:hypothetical protein